ncbi:unnamed protein product, partial [Callosobruchus maculatus]
MVVFSTGILILAISLTDTTIKLTVSTILIVATFVASSTSDEYSLNNYNQANTQRAQTPTYRGTAAPVTQTTAVREDTSKRGNTVYLQQNSYPQDAYQQSTVADYNDNRYDTVADDQAIYRQSSRQPTASRQPPPSRSRPTLKPTTSIVSKSQEFVDIYRHPPRRPSPIYPQPQPDKTAAKCRKDVCLLPDCSCGGRDIPGKLYK